MKTATKLTTGILAMAIMAGGAFSAKAVGQNPDAIDNARSTAKSLQQKQANDSPAAPATQSTKPAPGAPAPAVKPAMIPSSKPAAAPAKAAAKPASAPAPAAKAAVSTQAAAKSNPVPATATKTSAPAAKAQTAAAKPAAVAAKPVTAATKPTAAAKTAAPKTATKTVAAKPAKAATKKDAAKETKVAAPAASKPADAGKSAASSKPEDKKAEEKKPEDKKWAMNGKRDPFFSPVVQTNGSGCSTGKKCLEIGNINLRGVVKSESGFIAVVTNNLNKAYFLRENDPVFNGYVVKITGDSVVFQETVQDKLGKPFTREVVKRIFTPAV